MSISGKSVLITGGTSGIGLAVAKAFAGEGARVWITGRRDDGATIANDIGTSFIKSDVTDEAEVNAAFKAATQDGKLDVLILNAGIAVDTEGLAATPSQVMRDIMETNVMGVYFGLKLAPTYMNDGGSIITTGSAAGSGITTFGSGEYAASKAAAAYLTRTAAIEFADRAIRANVVCPAAIAGTGMMVADDGNPMAQFYATLTALGRMGNDTEAVALYRFLASEESSFITGQEIRIDGGATAGISGPITGMIAEKVGLG